MSSAFSRAYAVGLNRPTVFGLRLQPITLGHLFLLERLNCALFKDEAEFSDIGLAVFACHAPAGESERMMKKWWFTWFLKFWGWRATPEWITEDIQTFRQYLMEGLSSPPIRPAKRGDGSSKVCVAPAPFIKLFFAEHVLHMSRQEAMDSPVAELNSLYAVWAEWSGSGELVDEDRLSEFMAFAREQDSKRFNPDGTPKDMEAG